MLGLIAVAGLGLGPTFPFTVVVVQNAVALHQLGVATGTMNFFRALGSTFFVSGFSAMVLAATPVARGLSAGAVLAGADAAEAFRWVFAAAIVCSCGRAGLHSGAPGRPLRGSARPAKRVDDPLHAEETCGGFFAAARKSRWRVRPQLANR